MASKAVITISEDGHGDLKITLDLEPKSAPGTVSLLTPHVIAQSVMENLRFATLLSGSFGEPNTTTH